MVRLSTDARHATPGGTSGPSGGEPLSPTIQRELESSFRVNLQSVRVRTDAHAQSAAQGLSARAFTYGNQVFLGPGERPTDLGLMAHETAHVVQQQDSPTLQRSAPGQSDAYEHEAQQASAAVLTHAPFTVKERTHSPRVQRLGISSARDYFADAANNIPGFAMLTFVLGFNPINMRTVERNATNLFRAIIGYLPGGNLIFLALQRHGIVDRVGAWLMQQLSTLGMVASSLRQALDRFLDSLSWRDLLNLGGVWNRARRIFTEPIDRIISFLGGLVGDILRFIREAILRPVARLAEGTRGYDLLRLILGQDPITGDPYPRTPENMIGGFMRLIGQEEKWQHLQQSRAIPRAWAWFQQQMGTLLGFVREIPQLFVRLWQSLQISDLLDIGGAFNKVRNIFGGFVSNFMSWAGDAALQIMMFIFEALAPRAMPVLRRAASVIGTIVGNPIQFVGNLVRAGAQGFRQFSTNIRTHLINGLVGWLTGALTGAGLQLPERWDPRGILSLVLQILGLTWQNIRQKLVRHLGERPVAVLETTFDIVVTLVREGPAAAWQRILEQLGNLREMVFGQIRDWVARTVVGQAVIRIASMLNPAGAVIQAIMAIYNTIMFFRERLEQISQVAEAFFNSIAQIASGAIGAAATYVEQTMARFVPVVISFLARLIGLGGISDTIRDIITRIRQPIDRALDRVVEWIVAQARRLGSAVMSGARSVAQRIMQWWRMRRQFAARNGEQHTLFFQGEDANAELMIATRAISYRRFIADLTATNKTAAENTAQQLDAVRRQNASSFTPPNTKEVVVERLFNRLADLTGQLLVAAGPGANTYPGSGLDPIARTKEQLWQDLLPDPLPGVTETPTDIGRRRTMARGVLLQKYTGGARNVAQAILNFNEGREMRPFDVRRNENENSPDAHVLDRHVLNGSGRIKNLRDLALRALLDKPSTGGQFLASAYLTVGDANSAILQVINRELAAGWPLFRERIVNSSGTNVFPTPVSASANVKIWRNRRGAALPMVDLPAYLNGYTFEATPITGAIGTRPLYTGDPNPGLSGQPLAINASYSGRIHLNLSGNGNRRGGWWVITSYPEP